MKSSGAETNLTGWYKKEVREILAEFGAEAERGLTSAEAARRMAQHGPNELTEQGTRGPLRILWEQLTSTMVLILIAAAVVSGLLGDFKDSLAIGAIVVLFALLGFVQEYRAERAMAALKRMAVPAVRALRDGEVREVSARDLVPGDMVLIEAGNLVPADGRVLESINLRVQEAALTGESDAVEKTADALPGADLPLGDQRNIAYMGTVVTYGRGKVVVVATGMRTELGNIATMLQSVTHEQTPLQRRLEQLGKVLAVAGLSMASLVFGLGLLRGEPARDMLLTAVSIAVAIVPEGLPAVVTITLALGAQRMLRRNALIRKLPAVETLGSVTTICSDKTGTLTENRMTVVVLDIAGHRVQLTESLRRDMPVLEPNEKHLDILNAQPSALGLLLAGGALCNDALLQLDSQSGRMRALGDPTEGALLVAAAQVGLTKEALVEAMPRVAEIPFDSERKRMTTVHRAPDPNSLPPIEALHEVWPAWSLLPHVSITKGAVDGLLDLSTQVSVNDRVEPMSDQWRRRIQTTNDQLAADGMRVLGLAIRSIDALPSDSSLDALERELIFVGLMGLIDPPRPEVKSAVQTARRAGIRPVMITGDHPLTARHIARELGIAANGSRVLTGQDLGAMSAAQLETVVEDVSVFARVSPEHKLRIVEALQNKGHVVAMTGDGVNDAPALKRADIGVAMGITGTDVSKEAAEMVLRDDNFATIVSAVEEGRTIYDNLRKFVKFSVAGNIGKVAVMLLAPFLGKPLPLEPLQLLWLNLLTDGLLGLGLGLEPTEPDVMRRPPHSPRAGIFAEGMGRHITWVGAVIGLIAVGVGYAYWIGGRDSWQTMVFTTLAFMQIAQALATRSQRESVFRIGLLSNRPLAGLALAVFSLQLAVIYVPVLQSFFGTQALTALDLVLGLGLSALLFAAIEGEKWLIRRRSRHAANSRPGLP